MRNYNLAVCGGTFDLLHDGHKDFLNQALNLSEKLILGITSNSYISVFKVAQIEDYEIRKNAVIEFIKSINASDRVEVVSIDQADEPLLDNRFNPIAIIVTDQTEKAAIEINSKREKMNLPILKIEIVKMKKAQDGDLISSTRIRNGEINRSGRLYIDKKWKNKRLILPEELRFEFKNPFGEVIDFIPEDLDPKKIITIGDVTTKKFNEKGVNQLLSIVDFKVQRRKIYNDLAELGFSEIKTIGVENFPGEIMPHLFEEVASAIESNEKSVILVKGEEDLAFIPVLLLSPLGFDIFYGQPSLGLVRVRVTEENKDKIYKLLNEFRIE